MHTGAEDCILAKPKYAKQTRGQRLLWGGTTSARQIDTLDKMARRGRRAPQVGGSFVYFVCFASQNAILSQPSADSPFQKGPWGEVLP